MKDLLRSLFRITLMTAIALMVLLTACQNRMIYFPRKYEPTAVKGFSSGIQPLEFSTSQGKQTAYFVPPRSGKPVRTLWVLFNGNAGLALEWAFFVQDYPDADTAFLLIDYPGYGACEGSPNSRAIMETADAALAAIGQPVEALDLRTLGHSLGAANALAFAARHEVSQVVLISPFTSLRDMARQIVGWPLYHLLLDNYDNRARLLEIAAREPMPHVEILHGSVDELIPVAMGRELAALDSRVHFREFEGMGHNDILHSARRQIIETMSGSARP